MEKYVHMGFGVMFNKKKEKKKKTTASTIREAIAAVCEENITT